MKQITDLLQMDQIDALEWLEDNQHKVVIVDKNKADKLELLESKEFNELLYCVDGWHCEYVDSNYGNAKEWQRHLSNAYQKYQEKEDKDG